MRIGIKYCGGCNPTYEREKIEEIIRKNFTSAEIVYTSNLTDVDVLVLISGCKHACAIESIDENDVQKIVSFDEPRNEWEITKEIKLALKNK
ncbi:hypothetical protein DRP07_01775 [Archaeoglobales archaeon]|nr:MAG: hypothetical protein DRP07_01775 [Archaeoglobales archaeon]